jgi:DNA-binding FadR family transcriptional regulator
VDDLRGQILSVTLPDGSRLPSEQELATHYGVSGPTIREAIRVLTAMGLVSTRNGSRTTVTARSDALLVMSIASVMQFEKMSANDVLGVLGELYGKLAVERASDEDIDRLRAAAERTADMTDAESGTSALKDYFAVLTEISHNPLLSALCRSLTEIQTGLALELSGGSDGDWGEIAGAPSLHATRMEVAEAIARRDSGRAVQLMHDYHDEVIKRVQSLPRVRELRKTDPGLKTFLASWLGANVSISSRS